MSNANLLNYQINESNMLKLIETLKIKYFNTDKKVLNNILWLLFDNVVRRLIMLVVIAYTSRYLGVETFGIVNYATALMLFFTSFANLGIKSILVKEIVKNDIKEGTLLGTSFISMLGASLVSFLLMMLFVFVQKETLTTQYVFLMLGITLIIQSTDILAYYFESKVLSKFIVFSSNTSLIISSILRLCCVYFRLDIYIYASIFVVEAILRALALLFYYYKNNQSFRQWSFEGTLAKFLIKQSLPLMLSAVAVSVYLRIDQVMIREMIGMKSVGIYSAVAQVTGIFYFIPMSICSSMFPKLIIIKDSNDIIFNEKLYGLLKKLVILSYVLILFVLLFSKYIILILYGIKFLEANDILKYSIFCQLFVSIGILQSYYLISVNKTNVLLNTTIWGIVINVTLNYLLIPVFGLKGSALATIITYSFIGYFIGYFNKSLNHFTHLTTNALFFSKKIILPQN